MNASQVCPECGATHSNETTCQDDFHQMLYWEAEDPARGIVHHLMVLCYHLQHPSLYSPEGLVHAKRLLRTFVEEGASPDEVRKRNRNVVDSGKRKWNVTAHCTPGSYEFPVAWTMNAADVVNSGAAHYVPNVEAWAQSVFEAIRTGESASNQR